MLEQPAKKRKRSGKERQQQKAEAIAAAAAAAEADGTVPGDVSGPAVEAVAEGAQMEVEETMGDASHKKGADEAHEAIGDETIAEPSDSFDLEKVKGRVVSSRSIRL